MTVHTTVQLLRKIFSTFDLPAVLVSDNAPTFVAFEFKNFLKANGIIHKLSPPYHPATNGLAERCVQSFKNTLKTLSGNGKDIEINLCKFLINYRRTPHTTTGNTPSFLMFGRDLRTRLDLIFPTEKSENKNFESSKYRTFKEGEKVAVRDYLNTNKWQYGRVQRKLGNLIYLVQLDDLRVWKRHVDQIRSIGNDTPLKINFTPTTPPETYGSSVDKQKHPIGDETVSESADPKSTSDKSDGGPADPAGT
ncbi:uncharacterized protein K02A2.6-like, partial [Ceratina calcarata]|uniref:Uncharacterized protein K02A2.6-like n=1 Tax=Ceratina calcarata TaxID=156304 RepID=A0AAJ7RZQ8_9HYME